MSKNIFFFIFAIISLLCSCQKTLQEKAEREAHEYTRKYCPTPVINYMITDSVIFDVNKETFIYYYTLTDRLDDQDIIRENKQKIEEMLRKSITDSPAMKPYIQAGFHFRYICRSHKQPRKILLETKF